MLSFFSRGFILLTAFCSIAAVAQEAAPEKKPTEPVEFEYRGDVTKGETLAAQCTACHGPNGQSMVPNFPKIAGQHARYTYKQLQDMRLQDSGENEGEALRLVPEMTAIVAALSDQDMADLAAYFELQQSTIEGANPELVELGEKIYRAGNSETGVPACIACHQPDGSGLGLAGYPKLSGQYTEYTSKQLKAFRAAGREDLDVPYRVNDGETMQMRLAAKPMSDKEILAVSEYISGLMQKQKAGIPAEGQDEDSQKDAE